MRLSALIILTLFGLTISAQAPIPEGVTKKIFFDEFMDASDKWPVETTKPDIYANYKDGDYLISRKNSEKTFMIQANFEEISRNFVIKSAMELAPSSGKNGSIGLLVMFEQGFQGGIVYEFNNYGKYKISAISPKGFRILSSNPDKKGWTKSEHVKTENKLEIKAYAGVYEFYCNGKLLERLVIPDLKKGSFGMWVGAETLAKVQYYYAYNLNIPSQPDVVKEDIIVKMEKLKAENDSLQDLVRTLSIADGTDKPGAVEAMKILEKRITQLRSENEAMAAQLEKVKADADAGAVDLIDKMTQELADANHKNDLLRKNNQELLSRFDLVQEDLFNAKAEIKKLKSPKSSTEVQKDNDETETKESVESDEAIAKNESAEESEKESSTEEEETQNTEAEIIEEGKVVKIEKRKFKVEKAKLKVN